MVPLTWYLALSAVLFTLGTAGVLLRKNGLIVFMSIELMLNAANLALIAFARHHGNDTSHTIVLFVMAVAAAEAAVGLSIFIALFRRRESVYIDDYRALKY